MIIDSESQYTTFLNNYQNHDLIINVLGCDERYHSAADSLCAIFIKSITDGKDFVVSVCHPDAIFNIDKSQLIIDFSKLQGKLWTFDKKRTLHLLNISNLNDIHVYDYSELGNIIDVAQYQTPAHNFYHTRISTYSDINCTIPLTMHAQWFESVCDAVLSRMRNVNLDSSFDKINSIVVESLQVVESNGLKIDSNIFQQFFKQKPTRPKDDFVYTEYNLFTSTGRPSNRYGGINYAALKKDDGCRAAFVSRYGSDGCLFMIDYSAYHPRLIAKLVRYNLPDDVYNYLGKYYFNKQQLTEEEVKLAKTITFQLLYGNIPSEYAHIPFFVKIQEYIEHRWHHFNTHTYVETPIFKRRITSNNISEANPTKLFNYILQASETEYNAITLKSLLEYLSGKLTKPVLYTYDSILFDVHNSEKDSVFRQIKQIMISENNFPVKCYMGQNYHEMSVISI